MATTKTKILGRIAFAQDPRNTQIYWKCPKRGCTQIHYKSYIRNSPGIIPIYTYICTSCKKEYSASQISVSGTTAVLIVTFAEESHDES